MTALKKVAIFATGESMNQELIDSVFSSGIFDHHICVSNSYVFDKEFDAIVSSDKNWWNVHLSRIDKMRYSNCKKFSASFTDFEDVKRVDGVLSGINSGVLGCIVARKFYNAKFLGIFGVDLKGEHFFGSHKTDGLLDPTNVRFNVFQYQFEQEKKRCQYEKVEVINFSENSDLKCFDKLNFNEWNMKIGQ